MEYKPKPMTDLSGFKNTVRVVDEAKPELQMEKAPVETMKPQVKQKKFDTFAFELVKKLVLEEKKTYDECAKVLNAQGYINNKKAEFNGNALAVTMLSRGFRQRSHRRHTSHSLPEVKSVPQVESRAHDPLHEVTELISSNLSESFKERHLIMMAREWMERGLLK